MNSNINTSTVTTSAPHTATSSKETFLRRALLADAAFEAAAGVGSFVLASTLAEWFGLSDALPFMVLGVILMAGAALFYFTSTAKTLNLPFIRVIMIGNDITAAACIILSLAAGSAFMTQGHVLLWLLAIDFGALAVAEFVGLRKLA